MPLTATLRAHARPHVRRIAIFRSRDVEARLRELEAAEQENRRLHRRVAELTDVVTELLVPLAEGDRDQTRAVLQRYRTLI